MVLRILLIKINQILRMLSIRIHKIVVFLNFTKFSFPDELDPPRFHPVHINSLPDYERVGVLEKIKIWSCGDVCHS